MPESNTGILNEAGKMSAKQRLIRLQEVLKKYTDEDNELTLDQILDVFFQEYNLHPGRKAVRDDLKELEESGIFDVTVNQEKEGLEKKYSHQHRLFEIHELRLLIDAVSSAKFISAKETQELIEKIQRLASKPQAEQLGNRIILPENTKNENQQIKYTIHMLHTAVLANNYISFRYGRYNLNKEFTLSHGGDFYKLKPYALVWHNNFYYLIGEYLPTQEIRHYRVDRMRDVDALEETFVRDPGFDVSKYTEKLFHMYSGEEALVEIEFEAQLINVVIDKFGRGINVRPIGEDAFRISTTAIISDGLVKWLMTLGSEARVLTPPSLVEQMKKEAEKFYNVYH